jgi:hypothetical protein
MCPRTVRMPKEARTYSHGEKKTRKEVHNTRTSPELFPLLEHGRRLTSFADGINIDNAGIKIITNFISTRHTKNTNNTRSCWPIRHSPAHHTHHVSSTTTPRRLQWKLPSSRHSMARSYISSTYTSTAPLYMHTRTCTHLQASSPASSLPAPCRTALPHAPKQATPNCPNTHPLAHNRQR